MLYIRLRIKAPEILPQLPCDSESITPFKVYDQVAALGGPMPGRALPAVLVKDLITQLTHGS